MGQSSYQQLLQESSLKFFPADQQHELSFLVQLHTPQHHAFIALLPVLDRCKKINHPNCCRLLDYHSENDAHRPVIYTRCQHYLERLPFQPKKQQFVKIIQSLTEALRQFRSVLQVHGQITYQNICYFKGLLKLSPPLALPRHDDFLGMAVSLLKLVISASTQQLIGKGTDWPKIQLGVERVRVTYGDQLANFINGLINKPTMEWTLLESQKLQSLRQRSASRERKPLILSLSESTLKNSRKSQGRKSVFPQDEHKKGLKNLLCKSPGIELKQSNQRINTISDFQQRLSSHRKQASLKYLSAHAQLPVQKKLDIPIPVKQTDFIHRNSILQPEPSQFSRPYSQRSQSLVSRPHFPNESILSVIRPSAEVKINPKMSILHQTNAKPLVKINLLNNSNIPSSAYSYSIPATPEPAHHSFQPSHPKTYQQFKGLSNSVTESNISKSSQTSYFKSVKLVEPSQDRFERVLAQMKDRVDLKGMKKSCQQKIVILPKKDLRVAFQSKSNLSSSFSKQSSVCHKAVSFAQPPLPPRIQQTLNPRDSCIKPYQQKSIALKYQVKSMPEQQKSRGLLKFQTKSTVPKSVTTQQRSQSLITNELNKSLLGQQRPKEIRLGPSSLQVNSVKSHSVAQSKTIQKYSPNALAYGSIFQSPLEDLQISKDIPKIQTTFNSLRPPTPARTTSPPFQTNSTFNTKAVQAFSPTFQSKALPPTVLSSQPASQLKQQLASNLRGRQVQQKWLHSQSSANQQAPPRASKLDQKTIFQTKQLQIIQSYANQFNQSQYVSQQFANGTSYQGWKKKGLRNGHGKFTFKDGSVYSGQWVDNKMHGVGQLRRSGGQLAYEGMWVNDKFQGRGVLFFQNSKWLPKPLQPINLSKIKEYCLRYEGMFEDDMMHGSGRLYLTNGDLFEGQFKLDCIEGEGVFRRGEEEHRCLWKNGVLIKKLN